MSRFSAWAGDDGNAGRYADELVELTLKVLKFNVQKVSVAVATHRSIGPKEINVVRSNTEGTCVTADESPAEMEPTQR